MRLLSDRSGPGGLGRYRLLRPARVAAVPDDARLDEEGLGVAYREHAGELLGFATRSLGDRGLAEEAVQETFVRAWRARDRFEPGLGSLRTWLYAICRNVVVDLARARAARPVDPAAELPDLPVEAQDVDRLLAAFVVEEALRRLSEAHRIALVEVHLRGRAPRDVAVELGVPVGTVHSRVYYGLQALRLALDEMGWTGGDR